MSIRLNPVAQSLFFLYAGLLFTASALWPPHKPEPPAPATPPASAPTVVPVAPDSIDDDSVNDALQQFTDRETRRLRGEHERQLQLRAIKLRADAAAARVHENELAFLRERVIPAAAEEYFAAFRRFQATRSDLVRLDPDEQRERARPVTEALGHLMVVLNAYHAQDIRAQRFRDQPTTYSPAQEKLLRAAAAASPKPDAPAFSASFVTSLAGQVPAPRIIDALNDVTRRVLPKDTILVCTGSSCAASEPPRIAAMITTQATQSPPQDRRRRNIAPTPARSAPPQRREYCADEQLLVNRILPFRTSPTSSSSSAGSASAGQCGLFFTGNIATDNDYDPSGHHEWLEIETPAGHLRWVKAYYLKPATRRS